MLYVIIFLILFFPVSFLLISGNILYSLFFTGENTLSAIGWSKKLNTGNWKLQNSNLVALFGNINLKLTESDLDFKKVRSRKVKLELSALAGNITVILPEDTSFIAENKVFFGKTEINDITQTGLYSKKAIDNEKSTDENKVDFLFTTKSILGKVEIKTE